MLLDPSHPDFGRHTELRLYQAGVDHARRLLTASGLFHYNNNGRRLNPDGSRSVSVPFAGQGTGAGLSVLAGLIRPAEVRAGRIRHALRSSTRRATSPPGSGPRDQDRPAQRHHHPQSPDGDGHGHEAQLDPSVDCESRTVPGKSDGSRETRLRMICRPSRSTA